jgi:very-short-patch-repair endonuclease
VEETSPKKLQPPVLRQPIKQVRRARAMRKEMSFPEVLLWMQLQKRPGGHKFRKQVPQHPYALDFACLQARLAIEVDGEAHNRGDQPQKDEIRDRIMAERGFRTLRLPAYEVLNNMEGCIMGIVAACDLAIPPRNGEVARRSRDGGGPVISESDEPRGGTPPTPSGPPPRAGEDL